MNDTNFPKEYLHLFKESESSVDSLGNLDEQYLLFRDIMNWPNPETNKDFYKIRETDFNKYNNRTYETNQINMRAPEFKKNPTILMTGCSNSWGLGLPNDVIWPYLVAKEYDVDYVNTSMPGSSPMVEVVDIFKYCKTFGNPKIILAMFPDFQRSRVFVENKILKNVPDFSGAMGGTIGPSDIFTIRLIDRPNYVKLPAEKHLLVSQSQAFYNNTLFVFMLEQFCKSNGIKLIWSTWHNDSFHEAFSFFYMNYAKDSLGFSEMKVDMCNEHSYLEKEFPDIYYRADEPTEKKHPGVHWHYHVAEFFIDEINKRKLLS